MSTPTIQQQVAVSEIVFAIKDTVAEFPTGAPCGIVYAALSQFGCTLHQFEAITGAMMRLGMMRKAGDCFYPVKPQA